MTQQQVLVRQAAKAFLISQALFGIGLVLVILIVPTGSAGLIPLGVLFILASLPFVTRAKRIQSKAQNLDV